MPDVTLQNATDTHVRENRPSGRYSDSRTLAVSNEAGARNYSYLYFGSPVPRDATVLEATLRLYRRGSWAGSRTLYVRRLTDRLRAWRTTWDDKPSTGPNVAHTDPGGADGSVIEIDVTTHLQAVANGTLWYGLRLDSDEAVRRLLHSAQGVSQLRPTLYVSWVVPPTTPEGLTPGGDRAVSGPLPVLSWSAQAGTADATLEAVQVQVDPTGNFTAPAWDSGWVSTTEAQLDLRDTAAFPTFPPLVDGTSRQWRVRVRDLAGLESEWSDPATFFREALDTVTITNPAAASPVVTETTPPFLWTFSGVQVKWQVLVQDPANLAGEALADSGVQTSTATSWTPPKKTLTGLGPYRVVVRVWDAVAREATPLDPGYAEASRDFTVSTGATPPVTALAATQTTPWPTVVVSWDRATAPDSYIIRRDGNVLEEDVAPEDVLVSGTSYQYQDDSPPTWHPHTWQVQPVVNGVAGDSVGVVFTPKTRGIWLLDSARDRRVWIAGQEGGSWARGEESTVFSPLGASQVVRRVQGQRGYEGNLAGTLLDGYGRTAQEYEADLLAMRSEPNRPVVLALADLALRVLLGNVNTTPTVHTPPGRLASFDFWEVP